MAEENKTTLRLEIDRTIQPKQFESIKVIVDVQESFYWKDEKDRTNKIKAHTEKISEDFVSTFNHVVKRIGEEDRCIGKVITGGDVSIEEKKQIISSDDEFDFD
jgi:hypothetical protein